MGAGFPLGVAQGLVEGLEVEDAADRLADFLHDEADVAVFFAGTIGAWRAGGGGVRPKGPMTNCCPRPSASPKVESRMTKIEAL